MTLAAVQHPPQGPVRQVTDQENPGRRSKGSARSTLEHLCLSADDVVMTAARRRGSWPIGISISAVALGLLVARNCDAPDWQQGLMLLAAPAIAGAGAGLMAAWVSRSYRVPVGVGVALLVAAGTLFAIIVVWGGECSR
jgi:peptidoglycan/LPS O-acetylase OafA/YrhL